MSEEYVRSLGTVTNPMTCICTVYLSKWTGLLDIFLAYVQSGQSSLEANILTLTGKVNKR